MGRDRRPADELSIEDLEALLAHKRLQARAARLDRFQRSGRALPVLAGAEASGEGAVGGRRSSEAEPGTAQPPGRGRTLFNRGLLVVEVAAVLGLVYLGFEVAGVRQQLNQEVGALLGVPTPEPTPLITAVVLPSGHTPPTSPGGAQPNDSEIPENLRPLVQSLPAVAIPTPGPEQARQIFIPAIWNAPAPVIQGDGWEQLRRGVGQHLGTATPGQNGNVVLSAHNDIFGELFRDLDRLQPGDEVIVSTASRDFVYRVTGWRIVEPTAVEVMAPTERPTVTLISCYPYLVDTHRIVVFGELVDS